MSEELSVHLHEHEDATGRLCNALQSRGRHALALAREYLPGCAAQDETSLSHRDYTLADAETIYARRHGFEHWPALRVHLFQLGDEHGEDPLARAAEAIHARDAATVADIVAAHAEVLSTPPEPKTPLLGLAVGCREVSIVRQLLAAGASVQAPYPCGCRPIHRAAYGHPPEARPGRQREHSAILDALLEHDVVLAESAHGDGGTPLAMALFWGHTMLAEKIAAREDGLHPSNLRTVAGIGRPDLIRTLVDGDRLRSEAGEQRAFYRPHESFPEWQPSDDPQEILDEAFICASQNGRLEAMQLLLSCGANIDGAPYTGTALHRAAHAGPPAVLRWLVDHGADLGATWNMPPGSTPLHIAAAQGRLADVRYLVERGADPTARDEEFQSDPCGYAHWGGNQDVVEYLEAL